VILKCADWEFRVDVGATAQKTRQNASDHCECGYCKNFYETVGSAYPRLKNFLEQFGIDMSGPSELMPFEPAVILACYRVSGEILTWGNTQLCVQGVPVLAESAEDGTFLLWVGEMELPWVQQERPEDVVSPANLPEFMERMRLVWSLRHGEEFVFS